MRSLTDATLPDGRRIFVGRGRALPDHSDEAGFRWKYFGFEIRFGSRGLARDLGDGEVVLTVESVCAVIWVQDAARGNTSLPSDRICPLLFLTDSSPLGHRYVVDALTGWLHHDERTPEGFTSVWSSTGDVCVEATTGKLPGTNRCSRHGLLKAWSSSWRSGDVCVDGIIRSGTAAAVTPIGTLREEADQETIRWCPVLNGRMPVVVATSHR